MSEQLDRLIDLLEEVFELDKSDLDFGIYRILRIRKAAIDKFLREDLPRRVQETLIRTMSTPYPMKGRR